MDDAKIIEFGLESSLEGSGKVHLGPTTASGTGTVTSYVYVGFVRIPPTNASLLARLGLAPSELAMETTFDEEAASAGALAGLLADAKQVVQLLRPFKVLDPTAQLGGTVTLTGTISDFGDPTVLKAISVLLRVVAAQAHSPDGSRLLGPPTASATIAALRLLYGRSDLRTTLELSAGAAIDVEVLALSADAEVMRSHLVSASYLSPDSRLIASTSCRPAP